MQGTADKNRDEAIDVFELANEEFGTDPTALQRSLTMLSGNAAVSFYKEKCKTTGVKPNNTFLKILATDTSLVNFRHSLFGDRGMEAVAATIERIPVISLDLTQCGLSIEDITLLQQALVAHPTLTSIDLRGNALSVPSSRRLLSLAIQNRRITSIHVDDSAPKSILINRQCLSNADICVYASSCVICQKSLIYSEVANVEFDVLQRINERMGPQAEKLSPVELETIFRCLLACIDINDGVLFLCGPECVQQLAEDVTTAVLFVTADAHYNQKRTHPKCQIISKCAMDFTERLKKMNLPVSSFLLTPEVLDPKESDWKTCTVCGVECVTKNSGSAMLFQLLIRDLRSAKAVLRPSAFLRLVHVMMRSAQCRPCSVKCVRMLVRFGTLGCGGALMSRPSSTDQYLDSLAVPLEELPTIDFAVIDFSKTEVLDQGEEDITCAFAVASLVTDIDGIAMDPCFIFAAGRHLAKYDESNLGMELRHACEAVKVFGSLRMSESPFKTHQSQRNMYASWNHWKRLPNFEYLRKVAYTHRKPSYFVVNGPHGNIFDNIRGALWAHRNQQRGIVATIKWRVHWMAAVNGIIPMDKYSGGYYAAVKIVGHTVIESEPYLILQSSFGRSVGNRGFFYAPRVVINRNCKYGAYMFLDTACLVESTGMIVASIPKFHAFLDSRITMLITRLSKVFESLETLAVLSRRAVPSQYCTKWQVFLSSLPVGLLFLFASLRGDMCVNADTQSRRQSESVRMLFRTRSPSQIAFFLSHVLDESGVEWLCEAVEAHFAQKSPARARRDSQVGRIRQSRNSVFVASAEAAEVSDDSAADVESNASSIIPPTRIPQPPLSEGEAEIIPSPPSKGMPGKAGRPGKSNNHVTKAQEDAMVEKHRRLLGLANNMSKTERDTAQSEVAKRIRIEKESRDRVAKSARRKSTFAWNPSNFIDAESSVIEEEDDTASMSLSVKKVSKGNQRHRRETILPELVGAKWHTVNRRSENGVALPVALFFIKDSVCRYDCEEGDIVTPLVRMKVDSEYSQFPFSSGFDSVVVCPEFSATEAFFFSEQHWVRWDLCRNACTQGPHELQKHSQFSALPELFFHQRVSSAFPIPGTKKVVFSYRENYVILDLEQKVCVGSLRTFASSPLFSGMERAFNKCLMTSIHQWKRGISAAKLLLISSGGVLQWIKVTFNSTTMDCCFVAASPPTNLAVSTFTRLPLPFLQGATTACPVLQKSLIENLPRNKVCKISLFTPVDSSDALGGSIAPSVPIENLNFSWKVSVKTTLAIAATTQEEEEELAADDEGDRVDGVIESDMLLSIIKPFDSPSFGTSEVATELLSDCVLLRQNTNSIGYQGEHFIHFDFGNVNNARFAYLQMIVDASLLEEDDLILKPVDVLIECSLDGVSYRIVTAFSITKFFCDAQWGPTHTARYWRISFTSPLPLGFGIVKTIWYTAHWVTDSHPFELTESFDHEDSDVAVEGATVLQPPVKLLDHVNPGAVFATNANGTYYRKHCIIPLLPPSASCLVLCGTRFVEWDFQEKCIVGARSVSLRTHPAFSNLEFPFSEGIEACFYPDAVKSKNLVLVSGTKVVEWSLEEGKATSDMFELGDSPWFDGLPEPFASEGFDSIVNLWEKSGQIMLFGGGNVLRWNVSTRTVMEGPSPREKSAMFNNEEISGEQLLTLTAFPHKPMTFYLFCGSKIAVNAASRERRVLASSVADIAYSEHFPSLTFYLSDWGRKLSETVVTLDMRRKLPMIVGLSLRSSEGFNPETTWRIEYSDDSTTWNYVCDHQQHFPDSSSEWHVDAVNCVGHRFWRISTTDIRADRKVEYSQVAMKILPQSKLLILPKLTSTTGELIAPLDQEAVNGDQLSRSVRNVSNTFRFSKSDQYLGCILLDYGDESPPEIVGFAITSSATVVSDTWEVSFSDDATDWSVVGEWRVRTSSSRFSWAPKMPHQYWRLQLKSTLANIHEEVVSYTDISAFEYSGLSVVTSDTDRYHDGLAVLQVNNISDIPFIVPTDVGSAIFFDFKKDPIMLVGVSISSFVDSLTFMTTFSIEYSDDSKDWFPVGTIVVCDDLGNSAWESEGSHRFWRLLVSDHYGADTLRLRNIIFSICGPTLYSRHKRHIVEREGCIYTLRSMQLAEFVAVHATLPPNSTYIVEMAMEDTTKWESITLLHNLEGRSRACSSAWPACGSSQLWRLRDLNNKTVSSSAEHKPTNVMWSTFTGMRTEQSGLTETTDSMDMEGFELTSELANLNDLNAQPPSVLPPITTTSHLSWVTWKFNTPAFFSQVEVVCQYEHPLDSVQVTVQTSIDGDMFVPHSEFTINRASQSGVGFWPSSMKSRYWRVDFSGAHPGAPISVVSVKWMFKYGSPSLVQRASTLALSNVMQQRAKQEEFNNFEALKRICRSALDSACSFQTGLKEEEELVSMDMFALLVLKHQKTLQRTVARSLKEQTGGGKRGGAPPSSSSLPQFIDFTKILVALVDVDSSMKQLLEIVGGSDCVLQLSQCKLLKENSTWFFPKTEYKGALVQPLWGFVGCASMFSVRWLLSNDGLRDMTQIRTTGCVDPLIASSIFSMNVTTKDWFAPSSFPNQATFLLELGVSEVPLILALSSSTTLFSEAHPFTTPTGDAVEAPFPYYVYRGINLFVRIKPSQCQSGAITLLSSFLPRKMMRELILMTVHIPMYSDQIAFARFSVKLPAPVDLGVCGLQVRALAFEVAWANDSVSSRRVTFLSHEATYQIGGEALHAIVTGELMSDDPTVQIRVRCPRGKWSDPLNVHGTEIVNIEVSAVGLLGSTPSDFLPTAAHITGTLRTGGFDFPCRISQSPETLVASAFEVALIDAHFTTLLSLSRAIAGVDFPIDPWMASVSFSITAPMQILADSQSASCEGSVAFFDQSGSASASVTSEGILVSFSVPSVKVGQLEVSGDPKTGGLVLVEARVMMNKLSTIRINGVAALLTQSQTICQVELSSIGTVCLTSGEFFHTCIRDDSWYPIRMTATVSVQHEMFIQPLSLCLKASPLVSTLLSHGLPFSFLLQSITVADCDVARRTMLMTFRGVFMGSGFEVVMAAASPENTLAVVRKTAETVAEMIIEQCSDALWEALGEFVHSKRKDVVRKSTSFVETGTSDCFNSSTNNVLAKSIRNSSRVGTFVSKWADAEAEVINDALSDAFETQ